MATVWTYYRVIDGSYVRLDRTTGAAEEFTLPEAEWEEMGAWYWEILYNGGPADEVPEAVALQAIERQVEAARRQ